MSGKTHELKCAVPFFDAVLLGAKTFEMRRDDRGFAPGDTLHLREVASAGGYTGRECHRSVTYLLRDAPEFGLPPGFVVMALAPTKETYTREQLLSKTAKEGAASAIFRFHDAAEADPAWSRLRGWLKDEYRDRANSALLGALDALNKGKGGDDG